MHLLALAFLCGDLCIQVMPQLPSKIMLLTVLFISIFITVGTIIILRIINYNNRYAFLPFISFAFVLGFIFSSWYSNSLLAWSLPKEYENKPLWATGYIASLPIRNNWGLRFEFILKTIKLKEQTKTVLLAKKRKIELRWQTEQNNLIHVGDEYKFLVRLKQIHSSQNPGTADYEAKALQKSIRASGYVVANLQNHFLSHHWYVYPIEQLRERLRDRLKLYLPHTRTAPWLMALIIGERYGINPADWEILRRTGTNHLMVIGGLHIGILATFVSLIVAWCVKRLPQVMLHFPALHVGMIAALFVALIYSCIAGFSLSTQRACLMLIVFIFAYLAKRKINAWHAWSAALAIVIIANPLNVLMESFWLSFGTIALIIYGMRGRLFPQGYWWRFGRVQWVIAIGLIPLTLAFFQECSVLTFIANSFAIPWMEFLILPFCFLSTFFLFFLPQVAAWLLLIADKSLGLLGIILTSLAELHLFTWHFVIPNQIILMMTISGVILLLAPAGLPGKWLGIVWILPLLLYRPITPSRGEIWFTLLDVGQGLSAVVKTKNHVLVYDAGPKFSESFDAGKRIVVPYLLSKQINKIDLLVISHGDSDHIGGAKAILASFPVGKIITSVPQRFTAENVVTCHAGQRFSWDDVTLTFLAPKELGKLAKNDSSCVLRIDNGEQSILLPGDIETKGERNLMLNFPSQLKATILIAPHHGSKTSGFMPFILQVHPQIVLYATGYQNRYHFPHPAIYSTYQAIKATQINTTTSGAIQIKLMKNYKSNNKNISIDLYRISHQKYWYNLIQKSN